MFFQDWLAIGWWSVSGFPRPEEVRVIDWKCLDSNSSAMIPYKVHHAIETSLKGLRIFHIGLLSVLLLFGPLIYLHIVPDSLEIASAVKFDHRVTTRSYGTLFNLTDYFY